MEIKVAKIQYEKNLAEHIKTDNKSFWYHVRSNTNTKETVGNLETLQDLLKQIIKEEQRF